jgi:hypothetical protein
MLSVVCKGDVKAQVVGNFTASPVAEVMIAKLKVDGALLVSSATATFTENTSGATTPLVWKAKPSKLKVGGENILLRGASGPVAANHLLANASHKLRVGS